MEVVGPMLGLVPSIVRRWGAWLCLMTLVAGGTCYVISAELPKTYEGTTRLLVSADSADPGSSNRYQDVLAAERLTRTFAEILKARTLVEPAAARAGIDLPYAEAVSLLDVRQVKDTQLIQISARAATPDQAAEFANQLAAVLGESIRSANARRRVAMRDALDRQLQSLDAQIADKSTRLDEARGRATDASRNVDVLRLQETLAQLQQSQAVARKKYEDA